MNGAERCPNMKDEEMNAKTISTYNGSMNIEGTRWTRMVDEARAMELPVRNDCIYLIDGGRDAESVYLTEHGMSEIGLCEYDCQRRPVSERETLAGLLASARSEANQ